MIAERFKRAAMFPTNSTHWFMYRVIRSPHMFNQVLFFVELLIACCTFVPIQERKNAVRSKATE